ncbi:LacI family fructose operon transcriptional repressor [Neorhizobium huautlense]|uniref:LacI family fructose operon transcriptional repressor n=1 Tax=Neorhizobium huautlense TaxID=67774 RepID=A0ABT9PRX6_9HYPH|nr:substrate-binding domain-containing protein [Neorhizobium huautlense]MDP9837218.1 LacI family fructose operon transcriptional repressor [Neorhizobium huautlense]
MSTEVPKRLTIYDLAKLAGSSPSTVSAVLNGTWQNRRISEKLAARILAVAADADYSVNMQARALRRERSGIIGMILPLYDNRYFSSIAQIFEAEARKRGLFAIVSCTNRDPQQEQAAAQMMIAHRVEKLICTGATDPDSIARMCHAQGVETINLDLPGRLAPSVISDNRNGAKALTTAILDRLEDRGNPQDPILFVGGRIEDHNTRERIAGFREALTARGLESPEENIMPCGYSGARAAPVLDAYLLKHKTLPSAIFVNSTITLEGIARWFNEQGHNMSEIVFGCFDWDPLAAVFNPHFLMVRQNVPVMIDRLFDLIDSPHAPSTALIEIQPEILGVQ